MIEGHAMKSKRATSSRRGPQVCDPAFRQTLAAYRSLRARVLCRNDRRRKFWFGSAKNFFGFCFMREAIDCAPRHSLKDFFHEQPFHRLDAKSRITGKPTVCLPAFPGGLSRRQDFPSNCNSPD